MFFKSNLPDLSYLEIEYSQVVGKLLEDKNRCWHSREAKGFITLYTFINPDYLNVTFQEKKDSFFVNVFEEDQTAWNTVQGSSSHSIRF